MLLRLCSACALFCAVSFGGVLSYEELLDKPKSLSKDYYINRLITESKPTKAQAKILSSQIFRNAGIVRKNMDKLVPRTLKPSACAGVRQILDANLTCQNALTTIAYSLKLDPSTRSKLSQNLKVSHPVKSATLDALNEANPAQIFAQNLMSEQFIGYFNALPEEQKPTAFLQEFSVNFMDKLYATSGFTKLLNELVFDRKFNKFRENFLKINPQITDKNDAFMLGLNAITLGDENAATAFFRRASITQESQSLRDNAKFWLYLISKNDEILKELANSPDINIYSLFARDYIPSEPFEVIVPRPKEQKFHGKWNVSDPFTYEELNGLLKQISKEQAIEFAKQFYTNESIGYYALFMQKAHGYAKNYYVMQESSELEGIDPARKALIYALARQESRFIPGIVSTSYALGTMQFMPFLANAIGKKELKIPNFDQDDMFKPDVAYKFAKHHLDYLEKFLYHPLFIAYAYNGGIGFTKRLITRDDMFKDGKFEPFLSIELVPVAETRNYGKKVLANYIVYSSLTGSNIAISTLLQNLTRPDLTDKFRK